MKTAIFTKQEKRIIGSLLIVFVLALLGITPSLIKACNNCREDKCEYTDILDTSNFVDITTKNNIDLCQWAIMAYENDWGYVYGTWGNALTETAFENRLAQYPIIVGEHESFIRRNYIGKRVTDCAGLIKGYCWYTPQSRIIEYCGGEMPDLGANKMIDNAVVKGEIDTIPEILGLAVWADGHIGVYIGEGWVIEAMGTLEGVCKTRLDDRPWTHWCKLPYIEYSDEAKLPQSNDSDLSES